MRAQFVRIIQDTRLFVRYVCINLRIILKWAMGNKDVRRIYLAQNKYQCRSLRTCRRRNVTVFLDVSPLNLAEK
jgi:hypothetical protein